jgi:hypothetical protein
LENTRPASPTAPHQQSRRSDWWPGAPSPSTISVASESTSVAMAKRVGNTAGRRPVSHIPHTEPSFAQLDGDSLDLVDETAAHVMAESESARNSLIGQTRRKHAPRGRAQYIVGGIHIDGLASAPGFVLANLVLQPAVGSLSACAADAFIGRAGGADGQVPSEGGRPPSSSIRLSWVMSSFVPCACRCPEEQPHLDRWT